MIEVDSYSENNVPENPPIFTGRIMCPNDRDKKEYIDSCYEKNIVCVISSDNKFIKNVRVGKVQMQDIVFPAKGELTGSFVVVATSSVYNNPYLIAVVNDYNDIGDLQAERSFRSIKFSEDKESHVDIFGKADTGELDITVNSAKNTSESNFNFLSDNNDHKLKLYVQGDLDVKTDREIKISTYEKLHLEITKTNANNTTTSIEYIGGEGFKYKDEFDNTITIKDGEVNINSKKISLGNTDKIEKSAKGETLATLLEDLIEAIGNITTATAIGVQPVLNKPQFILLKQKVKNILSTKNYSE